MNKDILLAAIGLVLVIIKIAAKAVIWALSESFTQAPLTLSFNTQSEIERLDNYL